MLLRHLPKTVSKVLSQKAHSASSAHALPKGNDGGDVDDYSHPTTESHYPGASRSRSPVVVSPAAGPTERRASTDRCENLSSTKLPVAGSYQ